jgi:hypothetical protein
MPATGCGYMIDFAGEPLRCGTRLAGHGDVAPILCDACLANRRGPTSPLCAGCHEAPATLEAPWLCEDCTREYDADLAIDRGADDQPEPGEPGSRCTWRSCGYCGRCGGA